MSTSSRSELAVKIVDLKLCTLQSLHGSHETGDTSSFARNGTSIRRLKNVSDTHVASVDARYLSKCSTKLASISGDVRNHRKMPFYGAYSLGQTVNLGV